MIKAHRIEAYLLRHLYEIKASIDRKADVFLFPTIDLLVFGLLTTYIQKFQVGSGVAGAIIGGIILWTLVYNIQRDISFSVLEDAWNRNLYNLFSTPLRLSEIVIGILILSILKALLTIVLMLLLSYGLFGFNLLGHGAVMAFYIFNMFLFGWAFGFFTASLIFRFGTKVQAVAWSLVLLLYPVSGVFYPLETLPEWLASLARLLPISYVFEGLRNLLVSGRAEAPGTLLLILALNGFYLSAGVWLFTTGFKSAKNRGWFINPI